MKNHQDHLGWSLSRPIKFSAPRATQHCGSLTRSSASPYTPFVLTLPRIQRSRCCEAPCTGTFCLLVNITKTRVRGRERSTTKNGRDRSIELCPQALDLIERSCSYARISWGAARLVTALCSSATEVRRFAVWGSACCARQCAGGKHHRAGRRPTAMCRGNETRDGRKQTLRQCLPQAGPAQAN